MPYMRPWEQFEYVLNKGARGVMLVITFPFKKLFGKSKDKPKVEMKDRGGGKY